KVNKSLTYLKSSFKELDIVAKQITPQGTYFGIHSRFNNIVVIVSSLDDQSVQTFVEVARRYDADIYFDIRSTITSAHIKRDIDTRKIGLMLLSGGGIYNKVDDFFCSVGFWARSKNRNQALLITAGHCYGDHLSRSRKNFYTMDKTKLIGDLVDHSTSPHDFGLISVKRMSKLLQPSTNIRNDKNASYVELFVTDGVPVSSHGAHLCRAGVMSSVSCGYVDAFDGIFVNEWGDYQTDMIFVDKMASIGGDSGGTVFSFSDFSKLRLVTINGILIASSSNDTLPISPFSLVLPREKILNDTDLELITRF
ncbi:12569_t:CDS:1, partial [Cetraspora pellucida]